MKRQSFRKISALLLSVVMAFSVLLSGCTEAETEAALDIAATVLDTMLEESSEKASSEAGAPEAVSPSSVSGASDSIVSEKDTASDSSVNDNAPPDDSQLSPSIEEDEWYSARDEVALYIHTYGRLPGNYLTKEEASDLGWISSKGNLWEVAPGKSIGGDSFGNREGLLPKASGRKWYECDIDYEGGFRGEKRIVFSSDGLIYYTDDHYESFELLYE